MSSTPSRPAPLQLGTTLVGVHRGGQFHLNALAELATELPDATPMVRLIDALPGRAEVGALQVTDSGGQAHPVTARLEEVLPDLAESHEPVILAVDSPRTVAVALRTAELRDRWLFAYQLVRPPLGGLMSLRGVFAPGETAWREETAELVATLADFTTDRGAAFVMGEESRSADRASEPRHRAGMARHLKSALKRMVAGRPPESAPLTLSLDGLGDVPLCVTRDESFSSEPLALAQRALTRLRVPLTRGSEFAIAELSAADDGMRFSQWRLRTDGRLMARGRHVLDSTSVALAIAKSQAAEQAERERLARRTITRLNPVDVTD